MQHIVKSIGKPNTIDLRPIFSKVLSHRSNVSQPAAGAGLSMRERLSNAVPLRTASETERARPPRTTPPQHKISSDLRAGIVAGRHNLVSVQNSDKSKYQREVTPACGTLAEMLKYQLMS